MNITHIIPIILIILDIGSAVVYAFSGKWLHTGYWISAALITTFVTLMK